MPTFDYSAQGPAGLITGELAASDRSEAFALLGKKKIQPIKLEAAGETKSAAKTKQADTTPETISGPIKLKLPQVVLFIEELADLVGAGIQL